MTSPDSDDDYVRTDFLDRVAHELRGPASVTSSALHAIEQAIASKDGALQSKLAMAQRGVSRIVRVADRLERAAHLERGDTALDTAAVDLRDIATAAAHEAEVLDARRNVRLDLSAGDEPCVVRADTGWLQNAIREVVTNALRYARSVVSIDTRCVSTDARVTVRDDGPGFSRPLSLKRFGGWSSSGGLGLSMALVHEVLRLHRGRLEISLCEGDMIGGSVSLLIPLLPPETSGTP